jgi:hypothetical protein
MSPSNPDQPWQPREHEVPDRLINPFERTAVPDRTVDEHRKLEELDPLEDPQDPPDPSEASDPETVANANALK